jgi:DNA-binding CsgD family transcriptional regulator
VSRRRTTPLNDPVSRLAARDDRVLPSVLSTLSERETIVVKRYIANGESASAVAKLLGISPYRLRKIARNVRSKLVHPSRSQSLVVGDYRTEWDRDGFLVLIGDHIDLRSGVVGIQDEPYSVCEHDGCANVLMPVAQPRAGGRPRRYCSDACKQAAYRAHRVQSGVADPLDAN